MDRTIFHHEKFPGEERGFVIFGPLSHSRRITGGIPGLSPVDSGYTPKSLLKKINIEKGLGWLWTVLVGQT